MKKTLKIQLKITSIILVFTLLMSAITIPALAKTEKTAKVEESPYIVGEIESMRTETEKVFKMSDGKMQMAVYSSPVHFENEKGKWEEINNDLKSKDDDTYTTKNTSQDILLSKKYKKGKTVEITTDDTNISWGFVDANNSEAEITEKETEELKGDKRFITLPNAVSTTIYKDIYDSIDAEYIITGGQIKENLILNKETDQNEFEIEYRYKKLTPIQIDDKTIELQNSKKETVYKITAPVMTDDNGEFCDELKLEIASNKNNKLTVRLVADKEWLQDDDRDYPVTIDPSVTFGDYAVSYAMLYEDNSINYGFANTYKNMSQPTGYQKGYGILDVNLSYLNTYDHITNAELNLQFSTDVGIYIYDINGEAGFNYIENGVFENAYPEDHYQYDADNQQYSFNITKTIGKYNNYGGSSSAYVLRADDESDDYQILLQPNYESPILTIDYIDQSGINDKFSYHTFDVGSAGTAYLNDLTGQIYLQRDEFSVDSEDLPVTVGMTYVGKPDAMNWIPHYHQALSFSEYQGVQSYQWTNDTGATRYFINMDDTNTYYVDDNNEGYKLYANENKIVSPNNDVYIFDGLGIFLKKLVQQTHQDYYDENTESYTKSININYDDSYNNITSVTDGGGNVYTFTYDGLMLTKIKCGTKEVNYTYDSSYNKLISAEYNGKTAEYNYNSNSRLTQIVSAEDYKIAFEYYVNDKRVYTFKEYGYDSDSKSWTAGAEVAASYYPVATQFYQTNGNNNTNETYIFDKNGYLQTVLNKNGYAINRVNDKDGNLLGSTEVTIPVTNMIANSSFEDNTMWSGTYSVENTSADNSAVSGNKFARITNSEKSTNYISLSFGLKENETYTFSAYVKSFKTGENVSSIEKGNDIYSGIGIRAVGDTLNKKATGISGTFEDWTRVYVTFTVPENTDTIQLQIGLFGASGDICIDACQLEMHKRAYDYNIVKNSDFDSTVNWNYYGNSYNYGNSLFGDNVGGLSNNCLRIEGNGNINYVEQEIDIRKEQLSDLSVSAWVKTEGMFAKKYIVDEDNNKYLAENSPFGQISLIGIKDGGETYLSEIEINNNVEQIWYLSDYWYKVMGTVDASKVTTDYDTYKIRIEYFCPQGYLYVDGVEVMNGVLPTDTTDEGTSDSDSDSTPDTELEQDNYQIESGYTVVSTIDSFDTYTGIADCSYLVNGTVVNTVNEAGEVVKDETNSTAYLGNSWGVTQNKDTYNYTDSSGITVTNGGIDIPQNTLNSETQSGIRFWYKSSASFNVSLRNGTSENTSTDYTVTLNAENSGKWATILFRDIEKAEKSIANYNYLFVKATTAPVYIDEVQTVLADTILYSNNDFEDDEGYSVSESYEEARDGQVMKTVSSSKSLTVNEKLCTINRDTNSLGINTFTTTEDVTGNQISATDGNGNTVNYSYDDLNNLVKMSQTVDGTDVNVNYTYDNRGNISTITNGNVTYTYKYTPFGDLKSISVGNTALVTYSYISNQDRALNKITYANGQSINYAYDSDGMLISAVNKNSDGTVTDTVTYLNDETGEILKTTDSENGTVTLTYLDETQVWNSAETTLLYSYSSTNEKNNEYVNGTKFTTTYSSTDNTAEKTDLLTTETTAFGNLAKTAYSDAFGRVIKEEIKNGSTVVMSKEYTYNTNGIYITDQIKTEKTIIGGSSYAYEKYTYDNNGNITSIENLMSAGEKNTYEYDELGQLVKENSTVFKYDNYGNITKKGGYSYYYEDSNWKDKLTKRLNQTITYDESGNPLSYLGATLTWKNGRELVSYTKGTTSVTYKYNENGLRTQKTVNKNGTITTYNYTWSEDKLTHQSWGNNYMHFYYDYKDEIVGFTYYNGTTSADYTYVKNMQGDVISIVNDEGTRVADYSYDVWGRLRLGAVGIGLYNPIRYRGYCYDDEISMYYLQSRYYDPAIGRFINADDTEYVDLSVSSFSTNSYAYTDNNPICYIDENGKWKISGKNSNAIAEKGDTLKKLAKLITGDENNWKKLGLKNNKIKAGKKVDIKKLQNILFNSVVNRINKNYNTKKPVTAKFNKKTNTFALYIKLWFHGYDNKENKAFINYTKTAIKQWTGTYKNVLGKKKVKIKLHYIGDYINQTMGCEVQRDNNTNEIIGYGIRNKSELGYYNAQYVNFVLNMYPSFETEWPNVSESYIKVGSSDYESKRRLVVFTSTDIQNYKDYIQICRHEFGHCLYLADAYDYTKKFNGVSIKNNPGKKYGFKLCKGTKLAHNVMSCCCDCKPTSQEIAMVMFGFAEEKTQYYVYDKKSGRKVSKALKYFYS